MDSARIRLSLLVFSLAVCLAGSAVANDVTSVVGSGGALLRIHSGTYGELFPQGTEAMADSQVLALDVSRPGLDERFLVPHTESPYGEAFATLYYEKTTDLTFLLWEGVLNGIHPLLYVATFDGARWLDVVEIFGGSFTSKKDPQLVIRGDEIPSFKRSAGTNIPKRTIIFLVWSEDVGAVNRKRMVPLVMENGTFFGLEQRLILDDFLKAAGPHVSVDPDLRDVLRLQPGSRGTSAVVGFLSEDDNEIVTLGVELLPYELSLLAERVQEALRNVDPNLPVNAVVAQVRGLILNQGTEFNQGSLRYLADQIEALIRSELARSFPKPPDLPGKARLQIVMIGSRFDANGLAGSDTAEIIEVGEPDHNGVVQHIKITTLSRRKAPDVGGKALIFLSRAGYDVLVAWERDGSVYFQESEASTWGSREQIELSDTLTRDSVFELLANRILNR